MEIQEWKCPSLSSLGCCNELLKVLALAAWSGSCVFPWKAGAGSARAALLRLHGLPCSSSSLSLRLLPQQGSLCVLCLGIRSLRSCQGKAGMPRGEERSDPLHPAWDPFCILQPGTAPRRWRMPESLWFFLFHRLAGEAAAAFLGSCCGCWTAEHRSGAVGGAPGSRPGRKGLCC